MHRRKPPCYTKRMTHSTFRKITPFVGLGQPTPVNWAAAKHAPLTVIIGVTGVGKTTTLEALETLTDAFHLLPGRRTLTDQLIIPAVQDHLGLPVEPVTDRLWRFEMTAAYRELRPGGMADAITDLTFDPKAGPYLFDGLRGAHECEHAAQQLPNTHFIVLDAPNAVRVTRLLTRGDAFDQTNIETSPSKITAEALGLTSIFEPVEQAAFIEMVRSGEVTADEMRAKAAIVTKEAENYDPQAAIAVLKQNAAGRTLVINTAENTPQQAAQQLTQFLGLSTL